jgi:hypothetical protein
MRELIIQLASRLRQQPELNLASRLRQQPEL